MTRSTEGFPKANPWARPGLAAALTLLLAAHASATLEGPPDGLRPGERASLSAQIRHYEATHRYDLSGRPGDLRSDWIARNPEHGIRARFGPDAVRIGAAGHAVDEGALTLRLVRAGWASAPEAVPAPARRVSGNRIAYRRGSLTEWYVNDARGLE